MAADNQGGAWAFRYEPLASSALPSLLMEELCLVGGYLANGDTSEVLEGVEEGHRRNHEGPGHRRHIHMMAFYDQGRH